MFVVCFRIIISYIVTQNESSWSPCPIGTLPGGIIPNLSLPLIMNDLTMQVIEDGDGEIAHHEGQDQYTMHHQLPSSYGSDDDDEDNHYKEREMMERKGECDTVFLSVMEPPPSL